MTTLNQAIQAPEKGQSQEKVYLSDAPERLAPKTQLLMQEATDLVEKLEYLALQKEEKSLFQFRNIAARLSTEIYQKAFGMAKSIDVAETQIAYDFLSQNSGQDGKKPFGEATPAEVRKEIWQHYKSILCMLEDIRKDVKKNYGWDLLWLIDEQRQFYEKQRLDMAVATRHLMRARQKS